jgi:hypothetical protein
MTIIVLIRLVFSKEEYFNCIRNHNLTLLHIYKDYFWFCFYFKIAYEFFKRLGTQMISNYQIKRFSILFFINSEINYICWAVKWLFIYTLTMVCFSQTMMECEFIMKIVVEILKIVSQL